MVLVLGIGVQFASGVAASMAGGAQQAVATALPAVMLILVSTIAPMALFKLLAFVDPGTPSGASFPPRHGGRRRVQGLLTGKASAGLVGSTAASADSTGRSSGEQGAEEATGIRFAKATRGAAGLLGPVGQAAAAVSESSPRRALSLPPSSRTRPIKPEPDKAPTDRTSAPSAPEPVGPVTRRHLVPPHTCPITTTTPTATGSGKPEAGGGDEAMAVWSLRLE